MSATSALPATVEEIPLIDFQPFLDGTQSSRLAVAQHVRDACETIGFLYLRNHGVPDAAIGATLAASRHFFALPDSVRHDPAILTTPTRTRGYMRLGSRHYA